MKFTLYLVDVRILKRFKINVKIFKKYKITMCEINSELSDRLIPQVFSCYFSTPLAMTIF